MPPLILPLRYHHYFLVPIVLFYLNLLYRFLHTTHWTLPPTVPVHFTFSSHSCHSTVNAVHCYHYYYLALLLLRVTIVHCTTSLPPPNFYYWCWFLFLPALPCTHYYHCHYQLPSSMRFTHILLHCHFTLPVPSTTFHTVLLGTATTFYASHTVLPFPPPFMDLAHLTATPSSSAFFYTFCFYYTHIQLLPPPLPATTFIVLRFRACLPHHRAALYLRVTFRSPTTRRAARKRLRTGLPSTTHLYRFTASSGCLRHFSCFPTPVCPSGSATTMDTLPAFAPHRYAFLYFYTHTTVFVLSPPLHRSTHLTFSTVWFPYVSRTFGFWFCCLPWFFAAAHRPLLPG